MYTAYITHTLEPAQEPDLMLTLVLFATSTSFTSLVRLVNHPSIFKL